MDPPSRRSSSEHQLAGARHIAFTPLKPPPDPEHPGVGAYRTGRGNEFARVSEIDGVWNARSSIEWQILRTRPSGNFGLRPRSLTTQISNPGHQPDDQPLSCCSTSPSRSRGQPANSCAAGADERLCRRAAGPGRQAPGEVAADRGRPPHPKGGEDSIGAIEAIQRVYFNIGSCSEQCWVNHITDLRVLIEAS